MASNELTIQEFFIRLSLVKDKFVFDTLEEAEVDAEPFDEDEDVLLEPQVEPMDVNNEANFVPQLIEEPQKIDVSCVVCRSERSNVLLLNCKHVALCETCWAEIIADNPKPPCPLCKSVVESVIVNFQLILCTDYMKRFHVCIF